MVSTFKKFFVEVRGFIALLTRAEKVKMLTVFMGLLANGIFDIVGVGSVVPFLAVVGDPSVIHRNEILRSIYVFFQFRNDMDFVVFLGFAVVGFLVVTSAIRAGIFFVTTRFTFHRQLGLSSRLFRHYLSQAYPFFLTRNSAELIKRFAEDIPVAIGQVLDPVLDSVSKLVVVGGLITLVLIANPIMALFVVLGIGGVYVLLFALLKAPLSRMGKEGNALNRRRMQVIVETFGGIKETKFFNLESRAADLFHESARKEFDNNSKRDVLSTLPKFLMEAVAFGGIVSIVLFLILAGKPIGSLLPLLGLYAFAGYRLLPYFQQIFSNLTRVRYSFVRLHEVVRAFHEGEQTFSPTLKPASQFKPLVIQRELTVSHLQFSYETSPKPVLVDVNFSVPVNSTVGIVGGSGEGKSTLVDILLGLIPVKGSPLLLDGVPLPDDQLPRWQSSIGYVPQTIFLADASIAENVAFGVSWDNIDWKKMERAVEMASLTQLVHEGLVDGYKTALGERGVRLSGGQRQRVGIARALYRHPSILILDEATSSLDVESEASVMESIRQLGGSMTILIVAHRLSTLKDCDSIYRLSSGKIELVGAYQNLVEDIAVKNA